MVHAPCISGGCWRNRQGSHPGCRALAWTPQQRSKENRRQMPPDTIQPIQDILNRWILIGQALVGSIGALAFVVAFLWTKIGRFKARTNAPTINADNGPEVRPRDQAPLIGR